MAKKDRFVLENFDTDLKAKIDNFKFKNIFIQDAKKIYSKLDFESVSLEEYFKLIFGRDKTKSGINLLNDLEFDLLELPFEEEVGESILKGSHIFNSIVLDIHSPKNTIWIITKTLKELENIKQKDFVISAPITYIGRNRNGNNSRYLYAITIDLDYVGDLQLRDLLHEFNTNFIPIPNMITNSGNGLHITYLLKEPIPLYKSTQILLDRLKYGLIDKIWNPYTSQNQSKQYQNVLQGYRLPETYTKFGEIVTSYYNKKSSYYSIEELNEFLSKTNEKHPKLTKEELKKLNDIKDGTYNYSKKLEEAKEKWPEWYQERIVEGKPRKYISFSKNLYNWWLNKLKYETEVAVGHRYYCALALVSFATKCNVPYDEVKEDLYSLIKKFDNLTMDPDNHFLKEDIEDALTIYGSDKAYKFKSDFISKQTGIAIKKNKRNGRTREEHLAYLKESNAMKRKFNLIKKPAHYNSSKRKLLLNYLKENPYISNKKIIAQETGLSKPTVIKWYDSCKEELKEKNFYNKGTENFNSNEWKIYDYLKEQKDNKIIKKTNLAKELGMNYRTLVKYYDKIKEIVEQELAFESIFEEDENG